MPDHAKVDIRKFSMRQVVPPLVTPTQSFHSTANISDTILSSGERASIQIKARTWARQTATVRGQVTIILASDWLSEQDKQLRLGTGYLPYFSCLDEVTCTKIGLRIRERGK